MEDSQERVQTVVFMRHAVALHNIVDAKTGRIPDPRDEAYFDAPLVANHALGQAGAIRAGQAVEEWLRRSHQDPEPTSELGSSATIRMHAAPSSSSPPSSPHIQLIVSSPLTRCIQTALLAYAPKLTRNGDDHSSLPNSLSLSQSSKRRPTNTSYESRSSLIIHEAVREAFGQHQTDRRRSMAELQQLLAEYRLSFSFLWQFDSNMTDDDLQWSPHARESLQAVEQRIRNFLQWLVQRPESTIVVVTHGVWMEVCLHEFLSSGTRVYNCHAYACQVVSRRNNDSTSRLPNEGHSHQESFVRVQNVSQIFGGGE